MKVYMSSQSISLGNEYRFSKIDIADKGETTNIEFLYRDLVLPEKWRPRQRLWKIFYADMNKIEHLLRQENIQTVGGHYGPKMPELPFKEIPVLEIGTGAVELSDAVRKIYPDVKVRMKEIVYDDPDAYDEAEKKAPLRVGINLRAEDFQTLNEKISTQYNGSWPVYFASVLERLSQPMKAGYKIQ